MSFVSIANSLMSAFLLSYFLPSWRRGRFLINKERLFGNKERLLENKAGLLIGRKYINHHSKKLLFFIENNWIIVWIFRKYFVPL